MNRRDAERLIIIGASARAAAFSAARAGFTPHSVDLFADEDLRGRAAGTKIQDFGQGLLEAMHAVPVAPWMYTGGLENYPVSVERLANSRPLYGNRSDVLRRVRDPEQWITSLRDAGRRAPPWKFEPDGLPLDGTWLRKKLRGSGGRHVTHLTRRSHRLKPAGRFYYQRYVEGTTVSAVYVATLDRARLLGVTEQLTGCSWCGTRGFTYAGSMGPLALGPECLEAFTAIGHCLAKQFGLVGFFGVDAVMATDGVHTLEINPRYTASVEVLERALGIHALRMHVAACTTGELPDAFVAAGEGVCGKAIVYARRATAVSPRFVETHLHARDDDDWPRFADIPTAGSRLRAGEPVLSVFACGANLSQLEQALRQRVAEVENNLYGP